MIRIALNTAVVVLTLAAGFLIIKKHIDGAPDQQITVNSDVIAFQTAGQAMLQGRDIYHDVSGGITSYVYPPFYAFINIPLSFVSPFVLDVLWFFFNVVLIGVALRIAYYLFTGQRWNSLLYSRQWLLAGLSILGSVRYLVRNLQDSNVNMVVLVLILLGIYGAQTTGKQGSAVLIGIAAAIKVFPLLFLVYFAAKREWKNAIYLGVAFIGATVLPALLIGIPALTGYFREFYGYLKHQMTPDALVGENFSLFGFMGRLFSHSVAFEHPKDVLHYFNIASFSLTTIRYAVTVLDVVFIGVLYHLVRSERENSLSPVRNGAFLLTLLSMNLISILIEEHHVVSRMIAYLFLFVAWKDIPKRFYKMLLVFTIALSTFIIYDIDVPLFGKTAYLTMLSFAIPVLPVLIALTGLTIYVMNYSANRQSSPVLQHA
jgi:hypothetical protein